MLLDASSGGGGSTALTVFVIAIYFIPAIVAIVGRHQRWLLIALINLIFGWTVIGWFVALGLLATRRRSEPAPPPTLPTPSSAGDSRLAQLGRLAALRDSGALTEEEFASEKAKLLGN